MVNRSKRVGTAAEGLVVGIQQATYWPYAERRQLNGGKDRGDTTGHPGLVFEVKAGRTYCYPEWLRETEVERINGKADFGVLACKPRGVNRAPVFHALMESGSFTRLIKQAKDHALFDPEREVEYLETSIRKMDLRASLLQVNMTRAKELKLFGVAVYDTGTIPFSAMYLSQMLELLHLAGYGTELPQGGTV
jgi:hypothetical protein